MSRRLAHCIIATLAACLVATGCSLLVDTSHLDDPTPATTGEGGASSKDGTTAGDGGLVPDGDGSSGSSEGGTSDFCASHPEATFCEDFSSAAVDDHMVLSVAPAGGLAEGTLSKDVFFSPPGALHVRVTGVTQTGELDEPIYMLQKHISGTIAGFSCEIALRATAFDGDFSFIRLRLADGQSIRVGGEYVVVYFSDPTETAPFGTVVSTPPEWRRFRIGLDATAETSGTNAGKHRVWIDRIEPTKRMAEFFVKYDRPSNGLDVGIGGEGYDPRNLDYYLDDLMCTVSH